MDAISVTSPLIQSFKLPNWNPSFKSKFAKKNDDQLEDERGELYAEIKTLERIPEEAARMQVIDMMELTEPEKYRAKMVGYGQFKNFDIIENVK